MIIDLTGLLSILVFLGVSYTVGYVLGRAHGRLNEIDRPRREYEERERLREHNALLSQLAAYEKAGDTGE